MDKCREAFENSLGHTDGFHDGYVTHNPITGMYESNDDDYECVADWLNGAWTVWQSRQAEVEEKEKRIEELEMWIKGQIETLKCASKSWVYTEREQNIMLSQADDLEKALRGEQ